MAKQGYQRSIFVYADWLGLEHPSLMGILHSTHLRGKEIFSFEYDTAWLKSNAQSLDPDLQLYAGAQYLSDDKSNFGIFLDSSPDRWGRVLMDKREALIAKMEDRKARTLFETDYLLGVFDGHRMGALRFKENIDGPFLNNNKEMASPPWTSIRELEHASLRLEDEEISDDEKIEWINMLMAPGASLGGARPKASVLDEKGSLWIAKFPSSNDNRDMGAWEMVVYELAVLAGLNVAKGMTGRFYSRQHTYLTKRFDRTPKGERLHFASAMTLLGYTDGAEGVSYLELAEFLTRHGAQTDQDLEELWRRIIFYICVSNTDDHLRNHGFLLTEKGWTLSPAFDLNPNETGRGLHLNISEKDNTLDLNLAREVAPYFRIAEKQVEKIIGRVTDSVKAWEGIAEKIGISKREREAMSNAFRTV